MAANLCNFNNIKWNENVTLLNGIYFTKAVVINGKILFDFFRMSNFFFTFIK
jgi:hypothetical protein